MAWRVPKLESLQSDGRRIRPSDRDAVNAIEFVLKNCINVDAASITGYEMHNLEQKNQKNSNFQY